MDKILAILGKAKGSLTIWLTALIGVFSQIEPIAKWVGDLVNQLAPGKAVAVTSALYFLARMRSVITTALASLAAQKPPTA